MRLNLFEKIVSPTNVTATAVTAGSVLFCVAALAASLWSLTEDEKDSGMFILDSYIEQFGRNTDDDDHTLQLNFLGHSV